MSGLEILETNNYFNFNTNDPKREGGSNSQGIYQGGEGEGRISLSELYNEAEITNSVTSQLI